ncbi:MAG: hypothetical protein ACTSU5_07040 [Promethearchaeota archaeon]
MDVDTVAGNVLKIELDESGQIFFIDKGSGLGFALRGEDFIKCIEEIIHSTPRAL